MNRELPEVFDSYEEGQYAFLGFWAKGHWQPDKFGDGLRQNFGDDPRVNRCKHYRHTWARCIPNKELGTLMQTNARHGRGAFPVTVFEP